MNINFFYFIVASFVAFIIAMFLYKYPKKKRQKLPLLLFVLRFLSIIAILMLLINPKWEKHELSIYKPELVIAVDNSASISFVNGKETVKTVIERIKKDKNLEKRFDISYFSFGTQTKVLDSLSFTDFQTDPTELFHQIEALQKESKTPIVFITDGNQTIGNSYEYLQTKNPIYPIVIGDTIQYVDLAITQLNTNKYAFLKNKFPVEFFTLYKGSQDIVTQLSIYQDKKRIYTKKLSFTAKKSSQNISVMLPANKVGQHYYSISISPLKNEKNTQNNRKDFSIEVVDQQTSILILSSFNHPDLGAIKKSIESNKQRKVTIEIAKGQAVDLSKYHLVIMYQPTINLAGYFKIIETDQLNTIIITGTKTDWTFLNKAQSNFSKNATQLNENYLATYNINFPEFVTKDIGFDQLPPLEDIFGKTTFNVPYQSLLYQKIGNTLTESPLLATYSTEYQKNAVLFGEGLWRWRMLNKIENQSFKSFDSFWDALIQFTVANKNVQQLDLDYKKLCYSNQQQVIYASYVDKNKRVDTRASIWLYLKNKQRNKSEKIPFSLKENRYEVRIPNLDFGEYTFQVKVENQDIQMFGSFKVLDYNVEQQFSTANKQKLEKLAQSSGGKIIYPDKLETHLKSLAENDIYQSVQKSKKISKALIDWHWLLGFIILSLSAEWFIRKYKGLI